MSLAAKSGGLIYCGARPNVQTDAPDPLKMPKDDIVGVTVILLTCLYQDKVGTICQQTL